MPSSPEPSSTSQLIPAFLGADPIAGSPALAALLSRGLPAEEELFSANIVPPQLMQVRRRWLRYVASRGETVASRLLARFQDPDRIDERHASAFLFAGITDSRGALQVLYRLLTGGEGRLIGYRTAGPLISAWGYAGGGGSTLWHWIREDQHAWEILAREAFKSACLALARSDDGTNDWAIEQLLTHTHDRGLRELPNEPERFIPAGAINKADAYIAASSYFAWWRRGQVVDLILTQWSGHAHWRVRDFGAEALAALGFTRIVDPVVAWLRRESVQSVRIPLIRALGRSGTASGAEQVVEHFLRNPQEGRSDVAQCAWRCLDQGRARNTLAAIVDGEQDGAAGEAVVSLARLGQRSKWLDQMLESADAYVRVGAGLALGYLGDRGAIRSLLAREREASTPVERIGILAALAKLEAPGACERLHGQLVSSMATKGYDADFYRLLPHLKEAIIDGFASGGTSALPYLEAWRAELEPLEPQPTPLAPEAPVAGRSPPAVVAELPVRSAVEPLRVFISYSHSDEQLRKKLVRHLAPMVDEELIRLWHDREIDAGANWEGEINQEIAAADVILLLVSPAFLESRYCRKELLQAIDQRDRGKSRPIPILLRPCDWSAVFNRGSYKAQALPRDDRPVAGGGWRNQDQALATVAKELRRVIQRLIHTPIDGQPGSHA